MSTKQYLKMADVFEGSVTISSTYVRAYYSDSNSELNWSAMMAGYAAHAINSHDELVAEVERLREMVCRMGVYLEMSGEYPEKESDNPVRQWLYDSIQVMAIGIAD